MELKQFSCWHLFRFDSEFLQGHLSLVFQLLGGANGSPEVGSEFSPVKHSLYPLLTCCHGEKQPLAVRPYLRM